MRIIRTKFFFARTIFTVFAIGRLNRKGLTRNAPLWPTSRRSPTAITARVCALYTPFLACKPLISLKFLQTQKTWPAASLPALSCERGAHYTHPTQSHKPLEALFLQFLLNHFKRLKNTLRWANLKHKQGDWRRLYLRPQRHAAQNN